jgi:hypothetical protein
MQEDLLLKRIERYFKIASLVCSCCGEFTCIKDKKGQVIERIEDYGIYTKEEWEREMKKETLWMRENKKAVLSLLSGFEAEWPESCTSLRLILSLPNIVYN